MKKQKILELREPLLMFLVVKGRILSLCISGCKTFHDIFMLSDSTKTQYQRSDKIIVVIFSRNLFVQFGLFMLKREFSF